MSMNKDHKITYIKNYLEKPVVIVGLMGCGKSHVGSLLAGNLGLEFADSDIIVEQKAGCPVKDIFEIFGENKFREAEKNTILELLNDSNKVIATGGGAIANPETLNAIKKQGISIWLKSDAYCLFERIKNSGNRPLLQTDNPLEVLKNLMKKRQSFYSQADITVESGINSVQETLQKTIKELYDFLKKDKF